MELAHKLRVYELAHKLGLESKELIEELESWGITVKNHMSVLDEETVNLILEAFEEEPVKAAPKPSKPKKKKEEEEEEEEIAEIEIPSTELRLDVLASKLGVSQNQIIKDMFVKGIALRPGQELTKSQAEEIALNYNTLLEVTEPKEEVEKVKTEEEIDELELYFRRLYEEHTDELVERPPVVTVMGHVDHGKTTLLDRIRQTNVAEREAGGITQSIGAYQVEYKGKKITFIDTPGHEAFTAMRARGAQATDIVVLVVAADDGVMPQTVEAYDHARNANVPIIVAINKIDKPNANVEYTKQQLASQLGLVPEDWGGDTIMVPISAKTGVGIEDLLEMILIVAEMSQIKCYPKGRARGVIIESRLDRARGPVATVIVKDGILKRGDYIVAGNTMGRVKSLLNDKMENVEEAHPSDPVEVLGFEEVPDVHSTLYVVDSLNEARKIVEKRKEKVKKPLKRRIKLEEFLKLMEGEEKKKLNLIIKAESFGTVEAIKKALLKLRAKEVEIDVIHSGIGNVNASDVMLAEASNAVIIGFRVKVDGAARKEAEREGIQIRTYDVIFDLIEDIKLAMEGLLEPETVEEFTGRGEVKKVFTISKVGKITGVVLQEGYADKSGFVRVYRRSKEIFKGAIESLKHYKEDVERVEAPQECGIKLAGFDDIQEGDELEFYIYKKVKKELTFEEEEEEGDKE
ncbi:MAG TPA: translation initiation factor IF-2 [Thermotogae bacterium]|nr:translation initiation factor IF-2 [Thermotogota bacterium]